MTIHDADLCRAAPPARQYWLDSLPAEPPIHTFSPDFERRMEQMTHRHFRRTSLKTLLIAAVLVLSLFTIGTFAAESEWIGKQFHPTVPPADGEDYTISASKEIEPVSEEHLALHELPYAPELREYVSGRDLYIGNTHPVDGHWGCEKHGDKSHFVSVSEKLTVQRRTCALCGHKEVDYGISTIETCLTEPDPDAYAFCDHHEACEPFDKTAAYFEGWTVITETEYTEWEEDRSVGAVRISPCMAHNHFAHDQVEQIRYAITEYQCPDCPKIVPCVELERRTVCYTLTEGLTYAAEH